MSEHATSVRRHARRPARRLAVAFVALLVLGRAPGAGAAPGQADPSYGDNGSVSMGLSRYSLLAVTDGRVVVFGTELDGTVVARRVTAVGAVDPAFGTGGRAVLGPGDPNHVGTAFSQFTVFGDLDPTGRIIAVDAIGGIVRRLGADGAPDPTWPAAGVAVAGVLDLAVDSAGRPLLATPGGLVRLTSAGTVDSGFGSGGSVAFPSGRFPIRVDVDAMDRPVVGIQIGSICGPRFVCSADIARLTSSGAADSTFHPPAVSRILDIDVAPDGSILVGSEGSILRLAADGSRLFTAGTFGTGSVAVGSNGSVFAVDNGNGGVVALRADLTVDTRFGHCGYALGRTEWFVGDIVVSGSHLVATHVTTIEGFQLDPGGPTVPHVPGRAVVGVGSDGAVSSRGPACVTTGLRARPNLPVVGAVATPTYEGLWMVASDGGVFGFGDAGFFGSTGSIRLNRPVVGMAATPSGRGYWLVASDGGIFAFGDAGFFGSAGGLPLVAPVTAMAATTGGDGYWLVARDGGVFSYGGAAFYGRVAPDQIEGQPPDPVVAIVADPDGTGYAALQAHPDGRTMVSTFGVEGPLIAGPLPTALKGVALILG